MRIFLAVFAALMLCVHVPRAGADITIIPVRYAWNESNSPPWRLVLPGCNLSNLAELLRFSLVERDSPFGGTFYDLQSGLSEWQIFRVQIDRCPIESLRLPDSKHLPLYVLTVLPKMEVKVKEGNNTTLLAVTMYWGFYMYDADRIKSDWAENHWWVSLTGFLEWHVKEFFPKSPKEISELAFMIHVRGPIEIYKRPLLSVSDSVRDHKILSPSDYQEFLSVGDPLDPH